MIRLSGNVNRGPRLSRRRRISNQLAAFAAVMLFASTQVDAPIRDDSGAATPANVVSSQPAGGREADPDLQNVAAGEAVSQAVSNRRANARGINLSLFLFRR